ncbi:MAG: PhnD/SsuA/transferrin family substrate-binding protein, partial [Rhodoferax sp.]
MMLLIVWISTALPVWAEPTLKIGILAFRPKELLLQQWQPMTGYLGAALERPVEVVVFEDFAQFDAAIAQASIDVVLTNPGHFIVLQRQGLVSAALATQIARQGDVETASFGGVIIARADAKHLRTLADLADKRIAVTTTTSLGGYQMQAYEMLEAGVRLPAPERLLATGMPHDRVLEAVLSGQTEVGFLRAGIVETMAREGRFDLGRIKIINRQQRPDFAYAVSTRLYPEWPVAVLAHVPEHTARQLTVALLSLHAEHPAVRATELHGFTNAADYSGVDQVLRRLRAPPYSQTPTFTLAELWDSYRPWVLALGLMLLLVLATSMRLWLQSQSLHRSRTRLLALRNDLQSTLDAIPDVLLEMDLDGMQYKIHSLHDDLLVAPVASLVGKRVGESVPEQANTAYLEALREANATGFSSGREIELTIGQTRKWFELSIARKVMDAAAQPRFIVLSRDITERKRAQSRLQLSTFVFSHTQEAIIITDAASNIVEVNPAFTSITGYSRDEVLGKNPR